MKILRALSIFGYDDAPHGHMDIALENVRVPASEHAARRRARLRDRTGAPRTGPHPPLHALDRRRRAGARADVQERSLARVTFGKPVAERTVTQERIAEARIMIDSARLLVLKAAHHDGHGRQQGGARRDRDDQGARAQRRLQGARLGDPGARRRRHVRTTFRLPTCTRTRARCASPTGPTRCTATRSRSSSCRGT